LYGVLQWVCAVISVSHPYIPPFRALRGVISDSVGFVGGVIFHPQVCEDSGNSFSEPKLPTCTDAQNQSVRFLHVMQPLNHDYRSHEDGDAAQVRGEGVFAIWRLDP